MLPVAEKHIYFMTTTWPDHNFSLTSMEDHVVHVQELEYLGRNLGREARHWRVGVSCGPFESIVTLTDPFDDDKDDSLAWAIEQYPTRQPFEAFRARATAKDFVRYGRRLLEQLGLSELLVALKQGSTGKSSKLLNGDGNNGHQTRSWTLDIEGTEVQGRFQSLHWEALENPDIWLSSTQRPPMITVRRKVVVNEHAPRLMSLIPLRANIFRILLVVTHSMISGTTNGGVAAPRLVSGPLTDIVSKLNKNGSHSAVDLEIVRPGTWSGLRRHLEAKPRGWFHLVHFDVHARYDAQTKQTSMAFISEGSARKRTWRAGGEVSCLLAQFGVKIVILNASRCTASKGIANTSLAEQIIRDGARVVVAMPYKILNSAAEILFTTFYRNLLSNTWDIAQALSAARHAMRGHPTREARFGMKVPVMDWVAPVLYHNAGTELDLKGEDGGDGQIKVSNKLKSSKAKIAIEEFLQSFGEKGAERAPVKLERHFSIGATVFPGNEMLGRDGDIFEIETRILMENNILRLQGVPGVGKTTLTHHLCWWWKESSLVQDSFFFCFYQKPLLNVEMICRELYLKFYPPHKPTPIRNPLQALDSKLASGAVSSTTSLDSVGEIFPDNWMELTVATLRESPFLIVLDSLESSHAPKRIKTEYIEFLNKIEGGKSLVVLVCNREECWINDKTVRMGLFEIKGLEAKLAQTLGESILTRYGCSRTNFQAQGNRKYLHKMLKLFDRNPLVMELALPNIAKLEQPLEEIYIDLLQGSTSMKSSRAASLYATKSIQMLGDVFQSLDDVSKRLLLALAPFWQVIKKNIDIYLMCLVFHNVLNTENEEIGNAICDLWNVRAEGGNQARLPKLRALLEESGLTQKYHHLVQRLLSLGLLSINPKAIETSPEARESFYGIHPLLTIFLRQVLDGEHPQISVSKLLDAAALKRGFLDYFNQRSIAWSFYPEEAHIVAAYELMNEETNFLSAVSIPLQYGSADKCFCTFPSQIFIRLAAMSQVDRQMQSTTNLIAHFCESIVERFEELRQRRGNRRIGETPTIIAIFAMEWLCVYHAEVSGPEAFKTAINMTTKLMKYADENSSGYHHRLQEMIQQSCMQRAWAASDCLVDRLRLRRPFSGLISSITELPSLTSSGGDSSPKFMETWCKFASQYLRLHSLAVQAQLTAAFRPELRHQLRDDFKVLWKAGYKILTETSLTPLISLYSWVDPVLASTDPREATTTPKISSTRFTGYLEFIRSQVFLLFRDSDSAKRQLLTGLELARENSDRDGEKLCHLRLCDLAFRSRNFNECIAHSEFIHDLQVDFPDNIEVNNNHQHHLSFAYLVLREALCHRQINQWDSAAASFTTARTIAKFADERNIEYFAITKLAAIRQDHDIGFSTVTELLLDAIYLVYSDPGTHMGHRGILLRKMMNAAQSGKAGESMKDVIVRVAGRIGGVLEEVRRFLDDVIARERDIVLVRSKEGGSGADKIEGDIAELWRDAEVWLFGGGRGEGVRWRGTEWECGLRRV